jgi:hypothetical protein
LPVPAGPDAEIDVVAGDRLQVFALVVAAAAQGAALDPHRDLLRRVSIAAHTGIVAIGECAQSQVDGVFVQRLAGGIVVQLAQQALGTGHDIGIAAFDAEYIAAVGDLHAQSQLDQAQVGIERAGHVGQPLDIVGFQDEVASCLHAAKGSAPFVMVPQRGLPAASTCATVHAPRGEGWPWAWGCASLHGW